MAAHAKFRLRTAEELRDEAGRLGLEIPYEENISGLLEKAPVAGRSIPNRLAVLPMEGADAEADGAPSEWTFRRYRRVAAGGSGLIWCEATAVRRDGRSNPGQLMLTEKTLGGFGKLADEVRAAAKKEWGPPIGPSSSFSSPIPAVSPSPKGHPAR